MIGQSIAHYTIVDKLGEGGMGVVYKARDAHLDRFVALKVLPPEKVADPERKRRFVQEARAASALNHPNIVHIYDISSADGVDFIAMEYVSGRTLDRLIERKGLRLNEALGYSMQIADALAKAHAVGVVHRDLKPSNIMINDDGIVKVLDFGLAKLTEVLAKDGEHASTLTAEGVGEALTEKGVILGTVAYMSPEQASGRSVDTRSDVFSFGSVFYEMLTGRRAFHGESAALTLAAIIREEPVPLHEVAVEVPEEVGRVLRRCLHKDPQGRWQSMSDLKAVLQDLKEESDSGKLSGAAVAAVPRRASPLVLVLAAVAVIIAAVAGVSWWLLREAPPPAELELTRLTFDSGLTRYPAISADGKLVAYASDRGSEGNLDIYVQQAAGREAVRLTRHEADDFQPSFSPDGSRIAFRSDRDGGGVYIIDTLGGQERRIADRGWHPSYSPDGSQILYTEVADSGSATVTQGKMYLIPPQGGIPKPFQPDFLVLPYAGTGPVPIWSPDGERVLFNGTRGKDPRTWDWWVALVDGGPAVATGAAQTILQSHASTVPMAWFRDRVIFGRGSTVEGFNLYETVITSGSWQISGTSERLTTGPGVQIDGSVSSDGRLVFAGATVVALVWAIPLDPNEGSAAGEPQSIIRDQLNKSQPAVSRDGSKLAYGAFGSMRAGGYEMKLRDMGSGKETAFSTSGAFPLVFPRLSADGSTLAYRDFIGDKWRSFVVQVEGAPSREICQDCAILDLFSDSKAAVIQYGKDVVRQDLTSGERIPILTANEGTIRDASLSADDRWLALLLSGAPGRYAIYVVPVRARAVPEQEWILIDEETGYVESPRWSADGNLIYFFSERDGHSCIWAQRLATTTRRPDGHAFALYHEHRARVVLNRPRGWASISVARDKLVFAGGEAAGNIWMAQLRHD